MSMSYIYERFQHLLRFWMDIWLHIHTITTTATSPDLWELAQILPVARVKTMPLCFGWGCRTIKTASHVHGIHIWDVAAPSQDVDWHMASHSHCYHQTHFPIFRKIGWNPIWCKCANHAISALIEAVEPSKLHPLSMAYLYAVFEHLLRLWVGIWLHIHIITTTDTS